MPFVYLFSEIIYANIVTRPFSWDEISEDTLKNPILMYTKLNKS